MHLPSGIKYSGTSVIAGCLRMGFHRDLHEPALPVPHSRAARVSCAEALRAVPVVHEMMI